MLNSTLWRLLAPLLLIVPALANGAERPVILVVGDSLSAAYGIPADRGWVTLLERRLQQEGYPHRVVNASISGDTTQGGLSRIDDALARHEPAIVLLELGGNDGLRGILPEVTHRNLEAMIEQSQGAGARVVLLGIRIPPNYGPLYTRQFAAVFPDLAERHGLPLLPFLLEGVAAEPGLMQGDGIHPTAAAQPQILENVWAVLAPLLEKRPG